MNIVLVAFLSGVVGVSFAMEDTGELFVASRVNQQSVAGSVNGFFKEVEDEWDNETVVCARAGCIWCAELTVANGIVGGGLFLPKSLGCFLPCFLGTLGGALLAIPCVVGACWMHSIGESRMMPDQLRGELNL